MNLKKIRKRTEYDAYKRSRTESFELLNKNYCEKGATVLVGDSITEGYTHTEFFEKYTKETGTPVYNRGISGDTSDRLLERLEKTVLNIKPKNIVLLIGTNDLGVGADIDFIAENVEKIIEQSKKRCKNINIILESVYPVNTKINKQGRRKNSDILFLNEKLKAVAEKQKISFVDLYAALSDKNGMFNAEYTYDGLHANAKAYEMITKAVLPLLK
ncbi:MAG: hypothetical protein K2G56_04280 [Eubacterium sp.]|nr:hypothetical protein [Eubacterium sp.]